MPKVEKGNGFEKTAKLPRYCFDTIQQAAQIVRNELLKKEDWYNALVASINSTLHEESSEYLTRELAEKIADRLIGE